MISGLEGGQRLAAQYLQRVKKRLSLISRKAELPNELVIQPAGNSIRGPLDGPRSASQPHKAQHRYQSGNHFTQRPEPPNIAFHEPHINRSWHGEKKDAIV